LSQRLLRAAAAAFAVVLLSGCADQSTIGDDPSPASPAPTPTSTEAPPPVDPSIAFVVNGVLVSPDGSTSVGFQLTVHAPSTATADADRAAFVIGSGCPADILPTLNTPIVTPSYVHLDMVTTVIAGRLSTEDQAFLSGADYPAAWSGDFRSVQAPCTLPLLTPIPGIVHGVGVVESGVDYGENGVTYGWLPVSSSFSDTGYGMGVLRGEVTEPVYYAATECAIAFGPAAEGTAAIDLTRVAPESGCLFGRPFDPAQS
jgi:hypothetical protein